MVKENQSGPSGDLLCLIIGIKLSFGGDQSLKFLPSFKSKG